MHTQETIYKGIIGTVADAVAKFDNSVILGDIIYSGNVAKWKKLGNSLRMLMSLRLSKVYPGPTDYAATQFKAALADPAGSIATNADNFTVVYPGGAAYRNPWYNTYDGRKDFAESKTMTDMLTSLGDNRITVFGGATEAAGNPTPSSIGFPYGRTKTVSEAFASANPTWARILRGDLREQNDPLVVVSASSVLLARAEAAARGWTTEDMVAQYKAGVNASYEQWGLAAPAATYFDKTDVKVDASQPLATNLKNIAVQQWIAYYPNGLQAWANWRRTGYPVLVPAPDAVNTGKQIPRRYTYPTSAYGLNAANVKEAAARMAGGDTQDSRIWWDK